MRHPLFDAFIKAYYPPKTFTHPLLGAIEAFRQTLMHEESPLKEALDALVRRVEEPMKVAITGQFSSGKSTFLNALLSKNILPTGVTPVTSKVNYIRYGEEFKLQVHYYDGREAFYGVENIASFTDQRESVEQTKYLTLYAPLELLKEVVFVDTPGLNSQAHSDTETTQAVLREVDGIIWLTLMDNAGKLSEVEVLEQYMDAYASKSLCVLNQKDKFSEENIQKTTAYVKEALGEYFGEVVAISAKQALEARSHSHEAQLEATLEDLLEGLELTCKQAQFLPQKEALEAQIEGYLQRVARIAASDSASNASLLQDSNIEAVLGFISQEIRPQAQDAKVYAIQKELTSLRGRILAQHREIMAAHEALEDILETFEAKAQQTFEALKARFGKELGLAFVKIENIIDKIASEIFTHIDSETRVRYGAQKAGLLKGKTTYIPHEYRVAKIHADRVYKVLFYDEDLIGKMFKQYVKNLRVIQDVVNQENSLIYKEFERAVQGWQKIYEAKTPQDALHSKDAFAALRRFASKAYETFLKPFNDEIRGSYAQISSQFNHLSSAVSFNYQNATEVSVGFLERKISESIKLYEENPSQFPLYQPKLEEIKTRLRTSFHLYELENMMHSRNTFLNKNYDWLMRQFSKIKAEKIAFLEERKALHVRHIEALEAFTCKD
ncbi:dynamin family protein [Sulfurospirillum sp. T05]|uniref:Dynamin family protein n=1 Tax=Sulfurospirillum tamanense TaxID=2813362 RepID=A0ABS2WRM0_9BACT|nr:dynamin family protein [Sulfurospirillum tamanensis]MBN2964232.1 dynamin family protein [Sulfurospirillum tamanensis]